MGQSNKPQTIGYRYFLGVLFGIGKGLNGIRAIRAGGRTAWTGDAQGQARWQIQASSLFGGDQGEGGIFGTIDLMQGWEDQPVNPRLKRMLGSALVPAFRGCTVAFYDGLIASMNPYPKAWAFRGWRTTADWDGVVWYPAKVGITLGGVAAMNPAHMIYEAITNRDWGRGRSRTVIHEASFIAAADQLHSEGFGLCVVWRREAGIGAFIQQIIDTIGGVLVDDQATGQVSLKLIRGGYDVNSLPLFDEDSGLLGILTDETADGSGAVNQISVKFTDILNGGEDNIVRVQSLAGIQSVGAVIPQTNHYPLIPTAALAARVAQRDLEAKVASNKRFKVKLDRRGSSVMPGDVIRVRSLRRGYAQLVLRVGRAEYGTQTDGACTFTCTPDSHGMPDTSFVEVPPVTVQPPSNAPVEADVRRMMEIPYRDLAANLAPERLAEITSTSSAVGMLARRPSYAAQGFILVTRVGSGAWNGVDEGAWCPTAQILEPLDFLTTAMTILYATDLSTVAAGSVALIDDEIVRLVSINLTTGACVIARGCADTVPARHAAGARIWFYGADAAVDPSDYASGTTVQAKVQTVASGGFLDLSLAPTDSLTMARRQFRPYPPANVKVGGGNYPTAVVGDVVLSWAHRDRVLQADQLVDTTQASIGPEAGTTYSARLRRADNNSVLATQTGIAGTTTTLTTTYVGNVIVDLWSVRGGVESSQRFVWTFAHSNPPTP